MTTPTPCCRVAVAYSGGRDSTALLHATACAAREQGGIEVVALHVHHGLSLHADDWLAHAERACLQWAEQGLPVRLMARRVNVAVQAGDSVEALARRARYEALVGMAREAGADMVLLAHHRRDQAETVLLQALRGASVHGLAAMPPQIERDGVRWVRPWLQQPREAIEAYVAQHGLAHIEDDSNAHTRFARNRLRLDVWPSLVAAFPQAELSLAASARRVQDALPAVQMWREALLVPLRVPSTAQDVPGNAEKDAAQGVAEDAAQSQARPHRGARASHGLDAVKWSELSGPERRESLMHWYREVFATSLPASWVERLAHEVPGLVFQRRATSWEPIGLGLYRGVLAPTAAGAGSDVASPVRAMRVTATDVASNSALGAQQALRIDGPGDHLLPGWPGILRVTCVERGGISPANLARFEARPRQGGEQFQAGPGRPARALKKQFQDMGVPAWCRQGPILWVGGQLVFVPGLGLDARCLAADGAPQWGLEWVPTPE